MKTRVYWPETSVSVAMVCLLVLGATIWLLTTPNYQLAMVPGAALILSLLLGSRPFLVFLLVISLVPFSGYTGLSEEHSSLTITKLAGIFLVGITFFYFLFRREAQDRLTDSNLWILLGLFLVINFISAMLSVYPEPSFNEVRRIGIDYLIFLLTLVFITRANARTVLPWTIIISTVISADLSIIGYVFDIPMFAMNVDSDSLKRAVGASNDPNYFSAMLIFSLPILLHFVETHPKTMIRMLCLVLFFHNMVGVILTYSRGGGLVLGLTLALLFLSHFKRIDARHLGLVMGLVACIALSSFLFVPSSYWERQRSVVNVQSDHSIGRRVSYLHVGWDAFRESPLIGHGPGTFRYLYEISDYAALYQKEGFSNRRAAHNAYMEILVGTGMVGLGFFLTIVLVGLANFIRALRLFHKAHSMEWVSLTKAYLISYVTLLLSLMVLSAHHLKYLWVAFGLSTIILRAAREDEKPAA